jgi:hypothetical protein
LKAGMKLKSAVCDTEVLLVKAPAAGVLACGDAAMVAERTGEKGTIDPGFAEGTKMGKRYTDASATLEVLCIKPDAGFAVAGRYCFAAQRRQSAAFIRLRF